VGDDPDSGHSAQELARIFRPPAPQAGAAGENPVTSSTSAASRAGRDDTMARLDIESRPLVTDFQDP